MTKAKSESLGVDQEGVRPNSGLTNQQQEPKLSRPEPRIEPMFFTHIREAWRILRHGRAS